MKFFSEKFFYLDERFLHKNNNAAIIVVIKDLSVKAVKKVPYRSESNGF